MKRMALLWSVVLLTSFIGLAQGQRSRQKPVPPNVDWVEQTLAQMSLDEKVGQVIFPALTSTFTNKDSERFKVIERNIKEFHVGGYHAFGGDPASLALLVNRMQGLAKTPLLITADLEGGPGYQMAGATRLPRAMALGASGRQELAYQAGRIAAIEGRAMGIHVNFYPVVDVNNNPRNPIINIRSFGEDVALVSRMAQAYIRGAQEHGQIATAKHFPGHGDTSQDSHLELAVVDVSRDRLNQVELPPFRAAIEAHVGAVMTTHVYIPRVEPEQGLPATLSKTVTTDLLRQELGFTGLIFTDAMVMKGVADRYLPEDAARRAFRAGADIILLPVDVEKTFHALKSAVQSGDIPLARLDESVRRILQAKARLGLNKNRFVDLTQLDTVVGNLEHAQLARAMIEQAITLVRDEKEAVPLRLNADQRLLYVNVKDFDEGWREGRPGNAFAQELMQRHRQTIKVDVDDKTTKDTIEVIKQLAYASDAVVVTAFIRVSAYKGTIDLNQWQLDLLKSLSKLERPVIFIVFGSPYVLSFVPELPSYMLTYEYYPEAERAAVRAIMGEIPITGKLPTSLPGLYPVGHGLTRSASPAR
ncbi:MAG: glycoside hydrolase family 3 N-terminal domain-containing protein [Acidobacteriota bacterium]|nr:glycoside hydrolase family 3 protein [Blastocatellia bacterium]MDW8239556.1 glycoside hydrolase family 3 N-terminal domain-containing protein [Acidobacteriota bacterium]